MIWHAEHKDIPWWQNLSFNWFDIALLAILAFGFWRGRKRGMSREALPTLGWLLVVIGGGFGHPLLGDVVQHTGYVKKIFGTAVNERTAAYVFSYLVIAVAAFMLYSLLVKIFKEKVSGSNAFGSGEYYLGIISGMVRYACITLFVLALLNAPYYSLADVMANKAYKNRWYGGGLKDYNGEFIPTVAEVQASVFRNSVMGPAIKNNLGALLIDGTAPVKKSAGGTHF
jgi:uncharacterized membrane protein required for colicin V production